MAERGGQQGNQNAKRGFQATRALELALSVFRGEKRLEDIVEGNGMRTLVELWLVQIQQAKEEGDTNKMKLITERLDGRPRQAVDIGGQDDNPLQVTQVELVPLHDNSTSTDTE